MNDLFCKAGKDGSIDWESESDIVVIFEIATKHVRPFLPRSLQPIEPRPGVSLLWVALTTFKPNCLNYLPTFSEPNISIVVHNDLSRQHPDGKYKIPFMSFFVLSISSDNSDFLKHAYLIDKMPIHFCKNLQVKRDGYSVNVHDEDGPIFDLVFDYPDFKTDFFQYEEVFVQVYTAHEQNLYYIPVVAFGRKFEHQKKNQGCRLYVHPIFKGLDVSNIGPSEFYMQHFVDTTAEIKMRFYTPELIRPLQPNEWDPTKIDHLKLEVEYE